MSDLKQRLIESGIITDKATLKPLTGGVSSDIYLITEGEKKLVVKQALEKLKVAADWRADVSRNKFELRYLQYVNRFMPNCVPTVLDGDEDSGFFTMEFLDGDFKNLKTEFLDNNIDEIAVLRTVEALAEIHKVSENDEQAKALFDSTKNFIELRVSPYFYALKEGFPKLAASIDARCERLLEKRYALVHGDFSPKNILIDDDRSVLLDCEVAWYGNPSFDMAFFINHLLLKGVHLNQPKFFALAEKVLAVYSEKFKDISLDILELLPMLLLARVAGKSPAEYLTDESKQLIQPIAEKYIEQSLSSLSELIEELKLHLEATPMIKSIDAYQIYDSRGKPTVEVEVILDNGVKGFGLVPSGASTGQYEALELRDGDKTKFNGKSVYTAIENIKTIIAPAIIGMDPSQQAKIDETMIKLDGTTNKTKLGANAILGVSMACANVAANDQGIPLFKHLSKLHTGNADSGNILPLPEIQLIGGGAHAQWRTDVQDFLIIVNGAKNYTETLEATFKTYEAAEKLLKQRGTLAGIADEGGFYPTFDSHEEIFEFVVEAIKTAGYVPGKDISISLDIAASDLFHDGVYRFNLEDKEFTPKEFVALMLSWCEKYPVISIEDPFADDDPQSWVDFVKEMGGKIQIIGDDSFTTNIARIREGIENKTANSVLIKLNQIGSVTETLEAIKVTQDAGWLPVVSARSGETEDAFISHLAVAINGGQLKVGSFARSERMVKWNEVLRIERALGDDAVFIGADILKQLQY
ncbi:enolase [Vibrio halioticoli NBRC 102217]|uniref:Enolase n=1 Tax=Vibrio halioticoli NBRC 102217 TaxID=1219072 RepID=V5FPE2_9VIBR|nr:phosphopyruvate hydratase [Vibrio halioticoli]GAD90647.1 enolase [Vibrio halioticoli NBRC 102217]